MQQGQAAGAGSLLFAALVVVTVLQDSSMCKWSIWRALDKGKQADG